MEVEERLLKYISIKTPCDENSDKVPTTSCQFNLAKILADELKDLGLTKVILDDKCFVYGILPLLPVMRPEKNWDLLHTWIPFRNLRRRNSSCLYTRL